MDSYSIVWFAGLLALLGGFGIGVMMTLSWSPKKSTQQQEEEIKEYRHEVTEHFSETAKLLGQLAHSYREVHNHLADGAQNLCNNDFDPTLITLNKLPQIGEVEEEVQASDFNTSLNHDSESSSFEVGDINEECEVDNSEEYGLASNEEDTLENEEDDNTIAEDLDVELSADRKESVS